MKKSEYIIVVKSSLNFDLVKLDKILKGFDKDFELILLEKKKPFRLVGN